MSEAKHDTSHTPKPEAAHSPSFWDKTKGKMDAYGKKQSAAFKSEASALAQKSKTEILSGKRYTDQAEPLPYNKKILVPMAIIRNLIRGVLMNPLYRAGEILKPAAQTVESLIKIFADPIFS
ncbi:MAG: hypothetical protein WC806_05735, partial [Candidatus Gracilibacteria bacterium]